MGGTKRPSTTTSRLTQSAMIRPSGPEAFRRQWRAWQAAFPDLHFQVEEIVAEGETVVTRWTLTGTHSGAPFEGQPASGAAIRVGGMSLDHIRDGMIASGFDGWDELGFRRQLGLLAERE